MKRLPPLLILLCSAAGMAAAAPPPRPDLLRFDNDDQLHGAFQGVRDGAVVWQREDLAAPGLFKTGTIRKIILRGARPLVSTGDLPHVVLVNGDRLPGTLAALNDKTVTVNTSFAGMLQLPRDCVSAVAPMPLGTPVRYYGPYSEDGWLMLHPAYPDGLPPLKPKPAADPEQSDPKEAADPKDAADAKDEAPKEADAKDDADAKEADAKNEDDQGDDSKEGPPPDPDTIPRWEFSGAAWYSNPKKGSTPLVRKSGMGDRSVLRFDVAWRDRLMVGVVFHADFARPPEAKDDAGDADDADDAGKKRRREIDLMRRLSMGDPSGLASLFGNCYMLQLNPGYASLARCTLGEDGVAKVDRLPMNQSGPRLKEFGRATFELRCDRPKGTIALLVDGERSMEWQEPVDPDNPDESPGYAGKGGGFGFYTQSTGSPVRVSDVAVADWNGNPDSARSLDADDRDVVLLTNGTDRYSGKITGLENGKLRLTGKFGDFVFPLAEVAEFRFARNTLSEAPEPAAGNIGVRLDPLGRVSGKPLSGDARTLRLATPYAGEIEVSLDNAVMLDFLSSTNYLDDWDDPL